MRYLTATRIFDGNQFLDDKAVIVLDENNKFVRIETEENIEKAVIEKLEGIICPGFVNAHCHLELSHLKNKITKHTGITGFALELIAIRPQFSKEEINTAIVAANEDMWNNGIVAVGDISNTSDTFSFKTKSKIQYHTFIELIALNPLLCDAVMTYGENLLAELKNEKASLTPHAPYTVSAELMKAISDVNSKTPISIHNQESEAENEFFISGTGKIKTLYDNLKLDISCFKPSGESSLKTYFKNLNTLTNLILVHNTFASKSDIAFAEALNKTIFWCLCPNANLYIENTLPNIEMLMRENCKIVIGTDSLASNEELSLLAELNTILKVNTTIAIEQLLKWVTSNGAKALQMENDFGAFIKGKNSGLNHIQFTNNQFQFLAKLA